ncbi:hypothetical protein VNO77_07313 [Canavalia gladiata]|uniref:Pulmonary surfactant-associated protein B n=1 Tax=Canavalia gladiata TaxID=3824 RepID=A0AAN9R0I7_CANGL
MFVHHLLYVLTLVEMIYMNLTLFSWIHDKIRVRTTFFTFPLQPLIVALHFTHSVNTLPYLLPPKGTMEERKGVLFLILLGAAWACDARELAKPELNREIDFCALCEEYTTEALDYLNDKQDEIIDALHNTCHQLHAFRQQCIQLVDNYASHFFSDIASVQPGELCKMAYLCQSAKISSQVLGNSCGLCEDTVSAVLAKLNDPDSMLQVMEALLKACNSMEKFEKECKRMVFEYGPLILMKAEKFLSAADICTTLHACPASTAVNLEASIMEKAPLLSDS